MAFVSSKFNQLGATINGDAAGDRLGSSISLNSAGDIVAIGAIDADVNGSSSGQLKVFAWNGTSWGQRGTNINGDAVGDQLGLSVSLNAAGDVVAVASLSYVKIFAWNGTSWVQRGTNITGSSNYKVSLSPSGDVVAVVGSLTVQTFSWNGVAWVQRGANITGGSSISLATDILAVGYPNESSSGRVRIFSWNGTSWVQQGGAISDGQSIVSFGHSVSLDPNGSQVAVGCPNLTGNGSGQVPFVGVYNTFNGSLIGTRIRGKATTGNDFVGDSVSLNSNGSVIAIRSAMTSSDPYKGAVRIYVQSGNSWVQRGSDYSPSSSVSINGAGDVFAYGSTSEAGNAGGAFIYKFS